ncbi:MULTISPECIES: DNA-dependent RNA polymerase subunit epsilon [Bacillus]|uniref:DNA-dependent RNA polymerase subunit epsilon n=1 Tax=Bacillus TaxID=1386 RepID=UPI000BB7E821|nr:MULTISPECIES: DNA-directed RNA polymerase subunit epsilon [Bacillus]
MIYKVYFQEDSKQAPVRENTKSVFVEAELVRDVRQKLKDFHYNIEIILPVSQEHLQYEQQSEHFKVLEI